MQPTLYFLRSSEQKIVTDMLHFAAGVDKTGEKLDSRPELECYYRHYGLNHRDMGLYALQEHVLAGAAWIRLLKESDNATACVDAQTPVLMIAVKPEWRGQGIGKAMLEQLCIEAAALYERISVACDTENIPFFRSLGFESLREGVMIKQLSKVVPDRPSDGYDPTYWMD